MGEFIAGVASTLVGLAGLWFFYLMVKRGTAAGVRSGSAARAERLERLLEHERRTVDELQSEIVRLRSRLSKLGDTDL